MFSNNHFYVAKSASKSTVATILHYEIDEMQTWKQLKDVAVTQKALITLGVAADKLYVCSTLSCCVEVRSIPHNFNVIAVLGKKGSGARRDLLSLPRLCMVSDDETVMLADSGHHKLKTITRKHTWHEEKLSPKVKSPRGAVLVGNRLFVTGAQDKSLSLYKLNADERSRESQV